MREIPTSISYPPPTSNPNVLTNILFNARMGTEQFREINPQLKRGAYVKDL